MGKVFQGRRAHNGAAGLPIPQTSARHQPKLEDHVHGSLRYMAACLSPSFCRYVYQILPVGNRGKRVYGFYAMPRLGVELATMSTQVRRSSTDKSPA